MLSTTSREIMLFSLHLCVDLEANLHFWLFDFTDSGLKREEEEKEVLHTKMLLYFPFCFHSKIIATINRKTPTSFGDP